MFRSGPIRSGPNKKNAQSHQKSEKFKSLIFLSFQFLTFGQKTDFENLSFDKKTDFENAYFLLNLNFSELHSRHTSVSIHRDSRKQMIFHFALEQRILCQTTAICLVLALPPARCVLDVSPMRIVRTYCLNVAYIGVCC